jgi:tripartite-type tricarboxylate transporter receptor subunit TctC
MSDRFENARIASRQFSRRAAIVGLAGFAATPFASGQALQFPQRMISLVVPYGAGGGTDLLARVLAEELTTRLGQKVLVENIPGAGGMVGTQKAMSSPADGYTLLLGSGSELELAQITDPGAKLGRWTPPAPVGLIGTQPMVLVGRPDLPANNIEELVRLAKSRPGKLSYASAGVGTQLHLLGELLNASAGIDLVHVPYRAAGQIAADVIGGHVDLAVMVLPTTLAHLRTGKLKAFGVSDARRSPSAPDIPALAEFPPFREVDMKIWYGVFAPQGVPAPVLGRLTKELGAAVRAPSVQAKLMEMAVSTPEDTSAQSLEAVKSAGLARMKSVFEGSRRPARASSS